MIGFLALIVLGRLYSPEQFGTVETFIKLASVLAIISGLRYEIAIVVENDEKQAKDIVRLSLILNTIISLTLFIIILFFKEPIAFFFSFTNSNVLYLVPLMLWLLGCTETVMQWRTRSKEYGMISVNRLIYALSGAGYKITHPFTPVLIGNGLIIGQLIAQLLSFLHISLKLPFKLFKFSKEALIFQAKKYRAYPLFSSPAALLNLLAVSMPVFMISIFDSQASTGQFSNAYKLSYLPMSMLSMALGQVFFERIARLKENKTEAYRLAHSLYNVMFLTAVIPVTILAVWGDKLAPFILGPQWLEAGIYIQITIPFYFAMFMTTSFSSAFATYHKLKIQLVYNAVFLLCTSVALFLGYKIGGSTRIALAWFTVIGTLLRIGILNYFFLLFGKNLILKTVLSILFTCVLIYIGFWIKEGFLTS